MVTGTAAADPTIGEPVLSVRGLDVTFVGSGRPVPAVRKIDFDVYPNEVLGIVGESGSGKSVTSLAIAGLLPQTARVHGTIRLNGTQVTTADQETLRRLRAEDVGFIFQDPTTTLNPVLPVGRQITEGQVAHGRLPASQAPVYRELEEPEVYQKGTQANPRRLRKRRLRIAQH